MPTPQSVSRHLAGHFQRNGYMRPLGRRTAKVPTGGFEVMKSSQYLGAVVVMYHNGPLAVSRLDYAGRLARKIKTLHGYKASLEGRWDVRLQGLGTPTPHLLVTNKREEASK